MLCIDDDDSEEVLWFGCVAMEKAFFYALIYHSPNQEDALVKALFAVCRTLSKAKTE